MKNKLAFLLLAFLTLASSTFAQSNLLTGSVGNYGLAPQTGIVCTMTLVSPNPRTVNGIFIRRDPVAATSDANGAFYFTNVVWGNYTLTFAGRVDTIFKLAVLTNTEGAVPLASLATSATVAMPNPATNFYTMSQVDALVAGAGGGGATWTNAHDSVVLIAGDRGVSGDAIESVFAGYVAGAHATNAVSDVFIGTGAGRYAADAVGSTFIGAYAGRHATNNTESVFIGKYAGESVTRPNTFIVSGTVADVGTNALIYGEFDNGLLRVNGNLDVTGTITGNGAGLTNVGTSGALTNGDTRQINFAGGLWGTPFMVAGGDYVDVIKESAGVQPLLQWSDVGGSWVIPAGIGLSVGSTITGNGAGITNIALATNYASGAMSQQHYLNAEAYEGHRRFFNTIPFAGTLSWYAGGTTFASEAWMSNQMYVAETSGWLAAGANMLLIDDGWQGGRTNGVISEIASRWPSGLSNMIRNAHSRGFKVGIYTEPNVTTSGGMPGSLGYLTNDAARFVQWGLDLVKFDIYGSTNREHHVAEFSAALDRYGFQGHLHIGLGATDYAPWVSRYADSWRCSIAGAVDVTATTVLEAKQNILRNFDQMNRFPASSGPGRSGQLDSIPTWTGPSDPEALRTVSAIVGMMGGPMLMHSYRPIGEGNFASTFSTLSNTVAIIRDGAGMPPVCVWSTNVPSIPPGYGTNIGQQVWVRPLGSAAGPYKAVMLLNRDTNAAATISLNWTNLGFAGGENITFTDIYHGTNAAVTSMTVTVPALTALLYKAIPTALLATGSGMTAIPSPLIVTNTTAADGGNGSLSFSFTNSAHGGRIAGGSVLAGTWSGLMMSSPQASGSGGIEYQWCNFMGGTNETILNIPQYSDSGRITFRSAGSTILASLGTNGVFSANGSGITNSSGYSLGSMADTNWVLSQIASLGAHVYATGVTNTQGVLTLTNKAQGWASVPTTVTTNTVSAAAGQYVRSVVSTNTFARFEAGPISIEAYAFRVGSVATSVSFHPEIYIYDPILSNLVEVAAAPSQTCQSNVPMLFDFSVSLPSSFVPTNASHIVWALKIDSTNGNPTSLNLVSGGAYDSHLSFSVPAAAGFVLPSTVPLTNLNNAFYGSNTFNGITYFSELRSAYPGGNIGIGSNAAQVASAGVANVAVGSSALSKDTNGSYNVAIGYGAMDLSTNTSFNVEIGYRAGRNIQTGSKNTGVGYAAHGNMITGDYNTAIGKLAQGSMTSGSQNTAAGSDSQSALILGLYNSAFGVESMYYATNGLGMTIVGRRSGVGSSAADDASSMRDTNCTFLGHSSGRSSTIPNTTPLTNATSIGYNSKAIANNTVTLGGTGKEAVALVLNPMSVQPTNIAIGNPYIYSRTNASVAELFAVGGDGVETQISPHADDAPPQLYDKTTGDMKEIIWRESNPYITNGLVSFINMRRMARTMELQTRVLLLLCGTTNASTTAAAARLKTMTVAEKQVLITEDYPTYNARTGNNLQPLDWDVIQTGVQATYDMQRANIDLQRTYLGQTNAVIQAQIAAGDTNLTLVVLPEPLPVKDVRQAKPAWMK